MFYNKSLIGHKYIRKLWHEAHNIDSEKREDDPPLSKMCGAVAQLLRPDQARSVSLRTSSLLVCGAAQLYKKRLDYLLSDLQCLDKRMRTRHLYSSEDSDTDTEYEFDDGGTSTSSASKNDIKIRKKFVRDQKKKQSKKRESVSTDSSIREPEQMRDIQREAPVSPILPCKRTTKSTSPVTPDLHTDDGPSPVKKPCNRRISMNPIFSSPESEDFNHDKLVNLFGDAFFALDTIEKDCGESTTTQFSDDVFNVNNELIEFETLSPPAPLELGAEEEISENNKESALSPVLQRRNADENTIEVIQINTRNSTFNLEPTSSSEDHDANSPAEGAKSPLRFPDDIRAKVISSNSTSLPTASDQGADEQLVSLSPTFTLNININDEQNPESETEPCGLVTSPVLNKGLKASSNLDHTKVKRFTGKPSSIEIPCSPASEDTQTTTNHVSTQTEPPATPGSTLPYATTLVFSTSRVIPCKFIVSSAHPDILD